MMNNNQVSCKNSLNLERGKVRQSNLELFRILLMLMIIAHHYVVNSGLVQLYDFENITANMIFLQLFGWGGKTGINCFLLITGYFMCKQKFSKKKLLKLCLEIKFYTLVLYFLFLVTGYEPFSFKLLFEAVFSLLYGMNSHFTGGFIALYLIIPFLNLLLENLSKKSHLKLIGILLLIYTISSTFFFSSSWGYLGWYITIYLIGAYVRLYPNMLFENKRAFTWMSIISLTLAWGSILVIDFVGRSFGVTPYYFFVSDSQKILALVCSFSFFMLFKNINIKPNRLINTMATATFGVLLIHANSDTMRRFCWKDVLENTRYYDSPMLIVHAICSVIGVYVVCVIIDLLRIHFIERPFFKFIDSKKIKINAIFTKFKSHFNLIYDDKKF